MKTLKEKEMKPDNKKEDNGFYWSKDVKQFIKDIEEIIIDRGRRAFPEIKRLSGFKE